MFVTYPVTVMTVNDAEMYCTDCAVRIYGEEAFKNAFLCYNHGLPYHEDYRGNLLTIVLAENEDLKGKYCSRCRDLLYWNEDARLRRAAL
jgi:hypothetical protein